MGKLSLPATATSGARKDRKPAEECCPTIFFMNMGAQEIFEPDFLEQSSEHAFSVYSREHITAPHASSAIESAMYMDVKMTWPDEDFR